MSDKFINEQLQKYRQYGRETSLLPPVSPMQVHGLRTERGKEGNINTLTIEPLPSGSKTGGIELNIPRRLPKRKEEGKPDPQPPLPVSDRREGNIEIKQSSNDEEFNRMIANARLQSPSSYQPISPVFSRPAIKQKNKPSIFTS